MELNGKIAVVTGGAHGLGEGLCRRFTANGATVVVVDLDGEAAASLANELGGLAIRADVTVEDDIRRVVEATESAFGRVDVFMSNAGHGGYTDPFTPNADWDKQWQLHVMSNVWAARYCLPSMLERGSGYLLCTASTNGITTSTTSLAYAVTKHAQVSLYEWMAANYGSSGIKFSAFCPRWMWTDMTLKAVPDPALAPPWMQLAIVGGLTSEEAADVVVNGMRDERFLIVTLESSIDDAALRITDSDAWIRRLQGWHDELQPEVGFPAPIDKLRDLWPPRPGA